MTADTQLASLLRVMCGQITSMSGQYRASGRNAEKRKHDQEDERRTGWKKSDMKGPSSWLSTCRNGHAVKVSDTHAAPSSCRFCFYAVNLRQTAHQYFLCLLSSSFQTDPKWQSGSLDCCGHPTESWEISSLEQGGARMWWLTPLWSPGLYSWFWGSRYWSL